MLDYFLSTKFVDFKRASPKRLIVDTDMGGDDVQALFFLATMLKESDTQLMGITCTWGNTTIDNVVKNALIVRKLAGLKCGVYRGCIHSLLANKYSDGYFGPDGINGQQKEYYQQLTEDQKRVQYQHASIFIAESILKYPGEVTVLSIGPLTNIATALTIQPEISEKLKELICMGGTFLGMGNVPNFPNSEFNFYCDSAATHVVFKLIKNPIIVPIETCEFIDKQVKKIGGNIFGPPAGFIEKCFKYDPVLVDPLSIFFTMTNDPKDYQAIELKAKIQFDGQNTPVLLHWLTKSQDPTVIIITSVNAIKVQAVAIESYPK